MEHRDANTQISVYREFAPCPELRDYVRAVAWFGPAGESTPSPTPTREYYVVGGGALMPSFADAHSSLLFALGVSWQGSCWQACSTNHAPAMRPLPPATQP